MRDRDGSARLDLLAKQRDHTAVAAQHIAETHRHKLRVIIFVKRLNDHLTDTLGRSHHVGGVHRLIGGDHDEFLHAVVCRCLRRLPGSENIIFYCFIGADLHEGHMLMRRRMVHDIRLICRKDLVNPSCISHGSDQNQQIQIGIFDLKLLLDVIGVILVDIQND